MVETGPAGFVFGCNCAIMGMASLAAMMSVNLFAEPDALDPDARLGVFFAAVSPRAASAGFFCAAPISAPTASAG